MTIDPTARAVLNAVRDMLNRRPADTPDMTPEARASRAARAWQAAGYPIAPRTGRRVRPVHWAIDNRAVAVLDRIAFVAGSDGEPIIVVGSIAARVGGLWRWELHHMDDHGHGLTPTLGHAIAAAEAWWLKQEQARLAALEAS